MNDHLRSGKSISSTDNVDMDMAVDVDVDVIDDADTAKVVEVVKVVCGPSTGYEVAK